MEDNQLSNVKKNTWYAILVNSYQDNKYQYYIFKKGSFFSVVIGEDGEIRKIKSIEKAFEESCIVSLEECQSKEKALIKASNMYNKYLLESNIENIERKNKQKESDMMYEIKKMKKSLEETEENRTILFNKYKVLYDDKQTAISSIRSCLFDCCVYRYTESGFKYELVEPNELERTINPNKRKVSKPYSYKSDATYNLKECLCDIESTIDEKYKKEISDIIELYESIELSCFDKKYEREACEKISIQQFAKKYSGILSLTEKLSKFLIRYKKEEGKELSYIYCRNREEYWYDTHITIENDDLINTAVIACGNLLEVLKDSNYKNDFFAITKPNLPTEVIEQEHKTL